MISLTYMSTATFPFTEEQLTDLLADSRSRNHADGLTGMLLHAGGHFIQTLEGPEPDVDAAFDRISRDPRHRNVYVALRETIQARAFPDWSMSFEDISPAQAAALPGFNDYLDGNPPTGAPSLGNAGIFHRVFRDNMR